MYRNSFNDIVKQELENNPSPLAEIFLKYGIVTSPEKGYRLEFVISDGEEALRVQYLLRQEFMDFKSAKRTGKFILYLNSNEDISNFLAFIGAPEAALNYIDTYIEKDFNNRVNRQANCEIANIDKTVRSGEEQLKYIGKIDLQKLPPKLRETARLRLENPEMSLSELALIFTPPLTRSGVYHRLQKLVEIGKQIK